MLLKIFHLSVFALNSFSLWYDQHYVDLPMPSKEFEKMPFKGRFVFLTIWCLILNTVYFGVAFINDIFGSNEASPRKRPFIRIFKDTYFSVMFALCFFGPFSFWGTYFVNKNLILSENLQKALPDWLNHIMHSFVGVFAVSELLSANITYPSRKLGISLLVGYVCSYAAWVLVLHGRTGAWPYPMLNGLSIPLVILAVLMQITLYSLSYILGEKFNSSLSSSTAKQTQDKNTKRH